MVSISTDMITQQSFSQFMDSEQNREEFYSFGIIRTLTKFGDSYDYVFPPRLGDPIGPKALIEDLSIYSTILAPKLIIIPQIVRAGAFQCLED